jgi:hypothetical protein
MLAQADPPLPGAVFTTDAPCTAVNLNIYAAKGDVYINGGPAHPGAAGLLPNTSYYVQVTSPSGAEILGTSIGMAQERPAVTNSVGNFVSCYQLQAIVGNGGVAGYNDTPNPGGEYKVWVSTVSTFNNNSTKTDNFKVQSCYPGCTPPAGDGDITIRKFYDRNADGIWDAGEPELPTASLAPYGSTGWKVDIFGQPVAYTAAHYTGLDLGGGSIDYTTREYAPIQTNWYSTTPTPVDGILAFLNRKTVTLTTANPSATVIYGNVCTGAGGGYTLGFWSNKNGQALIDSYDLSQLAGLNLKNVDGSNFDPTTYAQLRTWLLNGNAVNMAYMLSVQLAAMKLSAINGKLTGGTAALVFAPGVIGANAAGFISVNDLMNAANASLGNYSLTLAGVPQRVYQELIKNGLDDANNNKTFVQSAPCLYTFAP